MISGSVSTESLGVYSVDYTCCSSCLVHAMKKHKPSPRGEIQAQIQRQFVVAVSTM